MIVDDAFMQELLQRITTLEREALRYRQGTVTDEAPLSVAVGGSSVPFADVPALQCPEPLAIDDDVAVVTWRGQMLVLGRTGTSPGTGHDHVATRESTASTSYTDLATTGPTITIPRAGDWLFLLTTRIGVTGNARGGAVGLRTNAGAPVDILEHYVETGTTITEDSPTCAAAVPLAGLAAGDVIQARYKVFGGSCFFEKRRLVAMPIRLDP